MAIADWQGRPIAVHVESATPHEVALVHGTLAERFVSQLPARLSATTPTSWTDWMPNWRAMAWNWLSLTGGPGHSGRKTVAR